MLGYRGHAAQAVRGRRCDAEEKRYLRPDVARKEHLVSMLAVPLIFAGEAQGVLALYTQKRHRFSNDEIKLISALSDLSAVAIEKGRLLARVVDMEEKLRASERLSALGLLAAEIAHEIRNPLTVMQMLFHALMEGGAEGPHLAARRGADQRKDAADESHSRTRCFPSRAHPSR